jgi:6-pyruvoyltetrahydropterin/6-carboxytetrahydropterin synthase
MSETQPMTIYMGLGSNLGDREQNLGKAIDLVGRRVQVLRRSPMYQTEPFGVPDQPKFLNMVIEAQTDLPHLELLQFLKGIEQELGRGAASSDAPRQIDIDILFYSDIVLTSDSLIIPHPRLPLRAFVLVPLNDLAPKLKHPVTGKTVAEMLSALETTTGVERYHVPAGATGSSVEGSPATSPITPIKRGNEVYYINVESHFDAAHFLRGYHGKCENLHGHRYKVAVKLSAAALNDIGLAYDFGDIKALLKPLLSRFDHTLLNDIPPFDAINPSAENIAHAIYDELKPKIAGAKLESVTVWESPESSVEYRAD